VKRLWLGWLIVVVVAIVFVRLGFWQISRLHERQAANHEIEVNLADPVASLDQVLSQSGNLEYRHVIVTGEYVPALEVLLRNRSYEGEPGYHVLTPLEIGSGMTVLVDRGWVPIGIEGPPVMPPPPTGSVQVSGVIRTSKTAGSGLGPKDPSTGTLTAVFWPDLARLAGQMPGSLEPVYVELRSQTPAGGDDQPIPASDPVLTSGPHLSYAVQWFAFAVISIVGYFLLVRKRRGVDRDT
jgi:surfeit locus 1 family protein